MKYTPSPITNVKDLWHHVWWWGEYWTGKEMEARKKLPDLGDRNWSYRWDDVREMELRAAAVILLLERHPSYLGEL